MDWKFHRNFFTVSFSEFHLLYSHPDFHPVSTGPMMHHFPFRSAILVCIVLVCNYPLCGSSFAVSSGQVSRLDLSRSFRTDFTVIGILARCCRRGVTSGVTVGSIRCRRRRWCIPVSSVVRIRCRSCRWFLRRRYGRLCVRRFRRFCVRGHRWFCNAGSASGVSPDPSWCYGIFCRIRCRLPPGASVGVSETVSFAFLLPEQPHIRLRHHL